MQAPGSGGSTLTAGGPIALSGAGVSAGPRTVRLGQRAGGMVLGGPGLKEDCRAVCPNWERWGLGDGITVPRPPCAQRFSPASVQGLGGGVWGAVTAGPRAGLGLTTRCLGLASDTSISSAPEFSPGEPDRKSIVSSSCLLSPSATVWMAVVHSSLQDAQVRPQLCPGPGASPATAPARPTAPRASPRGTCAR